MVGGVHVVWEMHVGWGGACGRCTHAHENNKLTYTRHKINTYTHKKQTHDNPTSHPIPPRNNPANTTPTTPKTTTPNTTTHLALSSSQCPGRPIPQIMCLCQCGHPGMQPRIDRPPTQQWFILYRRQVLVCERTDGAFGKVPTAEDE